MISICGIAYLVQDYRQRRAIKERVLRAKEEDRKKAAKDHVRSSWEEMIKACRAENISEIVYRDLEFTGGFSIPLIGNHPKTDAAHRANEALFILLHQLFGKFQIALVRGDPSKNAHRYRFESSVLDWKEQPNGFVEGVQLIKVSIVKPNGKELWVDAWDFSFAAE